MKKVLFLLLLITTSAFAQVEHGLLVGAGVGFPLQDGWKETTWGDKSNLDYRNDYKLNKIGRAHLNSSHDSKSRMPSSA